MEENTRKRLLSLSEEECPRKKKNRNPEAVKNRVIHLTMQKIEDFQWQSSTKQARREATGSIFVTYITEKTLPS